MEAGERIVQAARIVPGGRAQPQVSTGLPVLDHLVGLTARAAGFEVALELAPDELEAEVGEAGRALGLGLAPLLEAPDARGFGSGIRAADEALATVVVEAAERPLLASNVDLSAARVGGLGTDVAATFLRELVQAAGLTVHVRLWDGDETEHVLEAIFKALGVALAGAVATRD